MESVGMLLAEAERGGLAVAAKGEELIIRGPRSAGTLARRLLARKAEALALLDERLKAFAAGQRCAKCGRLMAGVPRAYDGYLCLFVCNCGHERFDRLPGTSPLLLAKWWIEKGHNL